MAIGTCISIITLNINELNAPTKKIDWLNGHKNKTCIYAVYKRPTSDLGTYTDGKLRDWKKIFHVNVNQKKAGVAISDKIGFKIKTVLRDKEGHYIMIKGSNQEDITTVNIYAPNTEAPQYVRQMLTAIKGEIDSKTILSLMSHLQLTDDADRELIRKHKP